MSAEMLITSILQYVIKTRTVQYLTILLIRLIHCGDLGINIHYYNSASCKNFREIIQHYYFTVKYRDIFNIILHLAITVIYVNQLLM